MRRARLKPILLCMSFFVGAAVFETVSEPVAMTNKYLVSSTGPEQTQALYQTLGEFRIVGANILWANAIDQYHHHYLEHGGDWSKNESLLPLLKTIIQLDPHFTQAYELMGGTLLPKTGHPEEGLAVLHQGILYNPNDWELYREVAMVYGWEQHNPQKALPYATTGLQYADDEFSRNLMTRLCRTLRSDLK